MNETITATGFRQQRKNGSNMKLTSLPIRVLSALLDRKEILPSTLTAECLDQIRLSDPGLGAFLTVTEKEALSAAAEADRRCIAGVRLSPLDGIPYALKDNLATDKIRTTAGSRMLAEFVPCTDAEVVKRLKNAGAVLLGKCNMDEFGMGNSTRYSAFRATRNPIDPAFVPGGSSGGCAAAVGAGMAVFSIGSDTGGSVRQPAAFCGITGFKPTYGVIPRDGLIAFASSLDTVGILARTPEDCLSVLRVIAGPDACDMTSRPYLFESGEELKLPRIALLSAEEEGSDTDAVRQMTASAVRLLQDAGYPVRKTAVPNLRAALSAYYIISSAEASSNLARYDGIRFGARSHGCHGIDALYERSRAEGFGDEVKRRILLGTHVLSEGSRKSFYQSACATRETLRTAFSHIFETAELILCPTVPCTAFRMEEHLSPAEAYQSDCHTVPASLCGLPAISIPCGIGPDGMPLALQLIAKEGSDAALCRYAANVLRLLTEMPRSRKDCGE